VHEKCRSCLIVSSFASVQSDNISGYTIFLSVALTAISQVVGIFIGRFVYRKQPPEQRCILRFSTAFSNAGFMGLPLIQSILGSGGIIYGSFYIVTQNFFCWSYGYPMMSGQKKINIKKILINPGMIGIFFGLPIYIFKITLPSIIESPVSSLAALNTPLAMIVVGSYIAKIRFRDIFDKTVLMTSMLRLIAVPAIMICLFSIIKPESNLFISTTIQNAAPCAAFTMLFSVMFKQDAKLASRIIASETILSVITIPLMTIAAQYICTILNL
jgi:predicted permease